MEIQERTVNGVIVLDLRGDVLAGEGDRLLRETVERLVEDGHSQIVLNLADVTHVDSAGLGELVRCYASVSRKNGELKVMNLTQRVHDLLSITKWLTPFDDDDDFPSGAAGVTSLGAVHTIEPKS